MGKKVIITIAVAFIVLAAFFVLPHLSQKESIEFPPEDNKEEPNDNNEEKEEEEGIVKGRVAIIIDDLGYNPELDKELAKIEAPLTLAILPFLDYTDEAVSRFRNRENFKIILHLPLEPISEEAHEEKMAMVDMTREEIVTFLSEALKEMKGAAEGLNNHKGSKFTSDPVRMRWLLEEIKERNLFFVDSYTSGQSVGYSLAKEMNIPAAKRDVFLDVVDEPQEIRDRLYELEERAQEQGSAIAIGHHKANTIQVLREELPNMQERGIELVIVSELLE